MTSGQSRLKSAISRCISAPLTARYAGWDGEEGQAILAGRRSLADLADSALTSGLDPQPRSGRQEYLESVVNRYV